MFLYIVKDTCRHGSIYDHIIHRGHVNHYKFSHHHFGVRLTVECDMQAHSPKRGDGVTYEPNQ